LEDRIVELHPPDPSRSVPGTALKKSRYSEGGRKATPLGVAALEDKIVQQAVVTILNPI
jgi:hypothetical protein